MNSVYMPSLFKSLSFGVMVLVLSVGCVESQNVEVMSAPGVRASSGNSPLERLGQDGTQDLQSRLNAVNQRIGVLQTRITALQAQRAAAESTQSTQLASVELQLSNLNQQLQLAQSAIQNLPQTACAQINEAQVSTTPGGPQCRLKPLPPVPVQKLPRVVINEKSIFNCLPGRTDTCVILTNPTSKNGTTFRVAEWAAMPTSGSSLRNVDPSQIRSFTVPRSADCEMIEVRIRAHAFFAAHSHEPNYFVRYRLKQNGSTPRGLRFCEPEPAGLISLAGSPLGCNEGDTWHPRETIMQGRGSQPNVLDPTTAEDYDVLLSKRRGADAEGLQAFRAREIFVSPDYTLTEDVFTFEVSHSQYTVPSGATVSLICHPRN